MRFSPSAVLACLWTAVIVASTNAVARLCIFFSDSTHNSISEGFGFWEGFWNETGFGKEARVVARKEGGDFREL